jgi:hypothetical protein
LIRHRGLALFRGVGKAWIRKSLGQFSRRNELDDTLPYLTTPLLYPSPSEERLAWVVFGV